MELIHGYTQHAIIKCFFFILCKFLLHIHNTRLEDRQIDVTEIRIERPKYNQKKRSIQVRKISYNEDTNYTRCRNRVYL